MLVGRGDLGGVADAAWHCRNCRSQPNAEWRNRSRVNVSEVDWGRLRRWLGQKKSASAAKWPKKQYKNLEVILAFWFQKQVTLAAKPRGFHLITREILAACPQINEVAVGMLHVFIQHTSAGLTINENADPDVRVDMETAANQLCPESSPFIHTCEGPDDMPAHVKASLFGASVLVPISDGRLNLGTWQGIYLCEHRDHGGRRRLVLTLQGKAQNDE